MKKIFLLILLLISACYAKEPPRATLPPSPPPLSPTPKPAKGTELKETDIPKYSNTSSEEILSKSIGYFVPIKYINHFIKTKSTVKSASYGILVNVSYDKESKTYIVQEGNFHEGGAYYGTLDSIKQSDEGIFTMHSESYEPYYGFCEFVYSEKDNSYEYTSQRFLHDDKNSYDMIKFSDINDLDYYLAYCLFKNSPEVNIKNNRIYTNINDINYLVNIFTDCSELEFSRPKADGEISFEPTNDINDTIYGYYIYKNNKVNVYDDNENLITSFSLKSNPPD